MSTSLFGARQYKSSKSLKKLAISSPINTRSSTDALSPVQPYSPQSRKQVVILRVSYDFIAESPVEITVKRNDYVKLLHRPGNGWLLVEFIDKAGSGLIPATYVDIIANDIQNPVSIEWLQRVKPAKSSKPEFVKNIKISTVLQSSSKRYLYRLDVTMGSGKQAFLCKYYQDFYTLHYSLKACLGDDVNLPKPPAERNSLDRSVSRDSPSKDEIKVLLNVASDLGRFMRELLIIEQVRDSEAFKKFIDDETVKRVEIKPGKPAYSNTRINTMLNEDAVNILDFLSIDDFELKTESTPMNSNTATMSPNAPSIPFAKPQKQQLKLSPSMIALVPSFMADADFQGSNKTPKQGSPKPEARSLEAQESNTRQLKIQEPESQVHKFQESKLHEQKGSSIKRQESEHLSLAESKSSQTLSTFSSLLAGYGEEDALPELKSQKSRVTESDDCETPKLSSEFEDDVAPVSTHAPEPLEGIKGATKPPSDVSHDSVSTIGNNDSANTHYSSGDDSLMSNSSRRRRSSFEPTTPIMTSEYMFSELPKKPFSDESQDEIKPLSPRRKASCDVSNSSSCATIHQEASGVAQAESEYIKVKVTLCNEEDDKVLLRVRRSDLHSMRALKQLLSFKIYKDSGLIFHYKLVPFDKVIGLACPDEVAILDYVKSNRKVHLRLQRVR